MDFDELLKQGKIKRIFRAKRKITSPNLVSHITQRAAGDAPLFLEDSDYLFMLSNLKEVSLKRSLDVYAFCLMPNHIHILLRPCRAELQEAMRDLFARYAMVFNRKYERKGHLFGGPYRQAVCLDDSYLLAASLYIHANPTRAGLATDPRGYRWSSIKLYNDLNAPPSFVKPSFVLDLLAKEQKKQREIYSKLLNNSIIVDTENALEKTDAVSFFRKVLVQNFPAVFSRLRRQKQIEHLTGLEMLDDEEIEHAIQGMRDPKTKIRPDEKKARKFLIKQLIARGYTRRDIATKLGISVKTVYNILKLKD
jgi:putative transposase